MKVWITSDGERIRYEDLDDVHLVHIIRLIKRKMTEGKCKRKKQLPDLMKEFLARELDPRALCMVSEIELKRFRQKYELKKFHQKYGLTY